MATTKKKAVKKAAPAKSKFKKKSTDGNARRGPKKAGVLIETNKLISFIIDGPAPRVIPGLLKKMISKQPLTVRKKISISILADLDEKTRGLVVKRYCSGRLSDEDKRLIKLGRGVDRLTTKKK